MKFNMNPHKLLCLLLCVSLVVILFAACGDEPQHTITTAPAGELNYTVEIRSVGGLPLSGINVYVYADSTLDDIVWGAKTDKDGKISFTATASDNYVLVLKDVPAGYSVAENYAVTGESTTISLESSAIANSDLTGVSYKLGDVIRDFSVTASDGTVYSISALLQQKKAVVLNFWYTGCVPCQMEFPHIQAAYDQYSDCIALLALDPVEADDAVIEDFRTSMGLTIPMAQCDPAWQDALNLVYPTTVVIDRFGVISLIHKGTVPSTETFENLFAHFSDDEYTQKLFNGIEEFYVEPPATEPTDPAPTDPTPTEPAPTEPDSTEPEPQPTEPAPTEPEPTEPEPTEPAAPEKTIGLPFNANNPEVYGGTLQFDANVPAGYYVYYQIYRVSGTWLQIESENAYVIYGGDTYWPENGVILLPVHSDSMHIPISLQIGNSGIEDAVFHVTFSYPEGNMMNPYELVSGDMDVKIQAGDEQGAFLKYSPATQQKLTIAIHSISGYENACIVITVTGSNGIPKQYSAEGPVGTSLSVDLNGGETVSINIFGADTSFSFSGCTVGITTTIE